MISDPKAVQHVYSNSYTFIRQKQNRDILRLIFGPGLVVADGDDHKRQRRVLQPAFGIAQLKALFPVFLRHSQKVNHPITLSVAANMLSIAHVCNEEHNRLQ